MWNSNLWGGVDRINVFKGWGADLTLKTQHGTVDRVFTWDWEDLYPESTMTSVGDLSRA